MLKIIKKQNGKLNVINDDNNEILPNDYNYIDIQENGIVARKDIDKTFLDEKFDLYNKNGNFLFSVYNKYDGNYVRDISFHIGEKYVKEDLSSTPDYDRWDHDSSSSSFYRHLDGECFNLGDYYDMSMSIIKNNFCLMENDDTSIIYDLNNKKIVFNYSEFTSPIFNMVYDINLKLNSKLKNIIIKDFITYFKSIAKNYKILDKNKSKLKKEILHNINNYRKYSSRLSLIDGYLDNDNYACDDKNLENLIEDLNIHILNFDYDYLRIYCTTFVANNKISARLLTNNIPKTFNEAYNNINQNPYNLDNEFGNYKKFTMIDILDDGFTFKVNKRNLTMLTHLYKKIIGKEYDLNIDEYCKMFNKSFINKNINNKNDFNLI